MSNQNQKKDEFFDTSYADQLNRQIKERLARPTLAEELQEQNEGQSARKAGMSQELKSDPVTYILLSISALFTAMLGLYLGLAPTLIANLDGSQTIHFNTDFGHVVTALLYVVSFIAVTEGAFVGGKIKFHTREEGNGHQQWTMIVAMSLAFISIVGTGWAGGTVVASTLGFLTEFKEIPAGAQKWVVGVIPVLLGLYAGLYTIYKLSSVHAKSKRITLQTKQKQELDHQMQMDMIDLIGLEQFHASEIELYKTLVMRGKLTAAEATAARRAGKTLQQLEKDLGRDLDDSGGVGDKPVVNLQQQRVPQNGQVKNVNPQ